MGDTLQFVDSVSASPTVRLDLNNEAPWALKYENTDFSPPDLRRSVSQTLLVDGAIVSAAAYDNRMVRLRLELLASSLDAAANAIQALARELDRPTNLLRWQPGTTEPVFFETMRSPVNQIQEVPGGGQLKLVAVDILCKPFAYGLKETLPAVTVYNDPAEGTPLNSNPYFETDASGWTASGGTIARSTAQAHQGAASLLLTPSGSATDVETTLSGYVPVTAGSSVRFTAWLRCAVARSADVFVVWSNGTTETGSASVTTALAANTWTLVDSTATAPAGTVRARLAVAMRSTPLASHLLYMDEARVRQAGGPGGASFEVTSPKGDVETPLHLRLGSDFMSTAYDRRYPVLGLRRRGTPSAMPGLIQAESMTAATSTALAGANDSTASGTGPNYMRVTATDTVNWERLNLTTWPSSTSTDVRGRYRFLARVRQSQPLDKWLLQLAYTAVAGVPEVENDQAAVTNVGGNWAYVDLGTIQLPYGNDPGTDGYSGVDVPVRGLRIGFRAQRVSGTGTLDVDLLMPVPADDAYTPMMMASDSSATGVIDGARTMVYAVGASGEVRAPAYAPQVLSRFPMLSPGRVNRVVWLADGAGGTDVLANTTTVTPYYWPKYLYARPPSS